MVIPTYNRAEMLRSALQSVLAQTLPAREIAVVDDGSTDHTSEVVEGFQAGGAPLVYLPGPHTNRRSEARNRGVEASSSPLIAFLDSDDIWKPRRLEAQVAELECDPNAGFGFCNVQRFDDEGPIGVPCLRLDANYNGRIAGFLLEEPLAVSSTLIVRREAFEAIGGFAEMRMNEDYELSLRLAARYPASYVPEVLVLMREHAGRTSRQEDVMPLLDSLRIVTRFLADHPDLSSPERARARRGLANVHFKLAELFLRKGEASQARRHAASFVRLRPWDRRALGLYRRLLSPPSGALAERG